MSQVAFRVGATILACLACAACATAQTLSTGDPSSSELSAPVRDAAAIAAIQSAIASAGGAQAITQIQNVTVQGAIQNQSDVRRSGTFVWTVSGTDFRYENDGPQGSHVFASNGGSPCDAKDGSVVPLDDYVVRANLPFHVPGLVLTNEMNNQNYSAMYIGMTEVNGVTAIHVQTADNSDSVVQFFTLQDWYLEAQGGLPLRVEYRIPDSFNAPGWQPGSMDFANYQISNGVFVPFQLTISEASILSSATVNSIVMNASSVAVSCSSEATNTAGSVQ